MSDMMTIFRIWADDARASVLHVEINRAIVFTLDYAGLPYDQVVRDVCRIAPIMMEVNATLTELYDGDLASRPKPEDRAALDAFLSKYEGRIPDDLRELFA